MSTTSLSHMHMQRTVDELHSLQKVQRVNTIIFVFFAIGTIIMSSFLSEIFGKSGKYFPVDPYSNTTDWQTCYIAADTAYIPLNTLVSTATAAKLNPVKACLGGALTGTDCQGQGQACAIDVNAWC
jgi:hypothetical protein